MITINEDTVIPESDLKFEFIRASGPGGQNVNKVATAVQLRFDVAGTRCLDEQVKSRLAKIAGKKISGEGILIITAQRFRSQEKNRQDAVRRLTDLICQAMVEPKIRLEKRPGKQAREQRLREKRRLAEKKKLRRIKPLDED